MRRLSFVLVAGSVMLISAGVVRADDEAPAPDDKKIHAQAVELINQLGDDEFSIRERATDSLVKLGLPALGALEEGCKHADREIRFRCERILVIVRESDFQRRLDAFAAGRDDEKEYTLPGWNKFRTMVGDDREARKLFVQMQKAEAETLRSVEDGAKAASQALNNRAVQLQQSMNLFRYQLSLGNVATMLFLAADDEVTIGAQTGSAMYSFCYQQSFRNAMQGGESQKMLSKLLGGWIRRSEDWSAYQGMIMAMQYGLKDGLVPAEKALKANANQQPHVRQYSILTIARFGDESHMPLLEGVLEDKTVVSRRTINKTQQFETQVRDIALATLLHLTKQDHKEYGFPSIQPNAQYVFNPSTLGFNDEEERTKAFDKWTEFREKQKKQ